MSDRLDELLAELKQSGTRLRVEGERLRYTAPAGALTPDLRAQLQQHKQALVERLRNAPVLHPPSSAQHRFWSLQQLNPSATFFNDPFLFRLRGPLDAGLLKQCFSAIVQRHEILRTTLQQLNGDLTQVIEPSHEIEWTEADLRGESQSAAEECLKREVRLPFDLAKSCGLRVLLVRTTDEEHLLHLCFHNTLFDFPSLMVILRELSEHYRAFSAGREPELPAPAQYSEFVNWQESLMASGMDERRQYWRDWFRPGAPPAWNWKHRDRPVSAPSAFDAHRLTHRNSPGLTESIRNLCRRHGVTPYIVAIAAFLQTMRHVTGCPDITIGTTYANRPDWRFASLIGATVTVPALRVDMSDDPDAGAMLARVRDVLTAALTYQDVPVDRVVPGHSRSPLFRVVASASPETPLGKLELPGIETTWLDDWIYPVSRAELYLIVWETRTLNLCWLPRKDVFDFSQVEFMNQYFEEVLTGMCLA